MESPDLAAAPLGSVVAPAGCGKTQEIVELVKASQGKPALVLTHTNAGVAALRARFKDAGVLADAFRLSTLDAWSQKLVGALPARSEHVIDPARPDYGEIQQGILRAVRSGALDMPLAATYGCALVDEYQDCSNRQHELVTELAARLPVRIFGDPLQAIFAFKHVKPVDWAVVEAAFPQVAKLDTPWRWNLRGCGKLGAWLLEVRDALEQGQPIDLTKAPAEHVRWVRRQDGGHVEANALVNGLRLGGDQRMLIIGDTSSDIRRHKVARQVKGVEIVERADLPHLQELASKMAKAATSKALLEAAISFAESIMTQVEPGLLQKRLGSLQANRAKNPAQPHETAALNVLSSPTPSDVNALLAALEGKQDCRVFRRDLYSAATEMFASARGFGELPRRAAAVIERRRFSSRRLPRRALGSTLLLKGLEADHVVVMEADQLDARHLYVALTRGARTVTIHSPRQVLNPTVPRN